MTRGRLVNGDEQRHTGRFAPSPTGPLHFGSLVAATGSYLQARHPDGRWLLRIEDIDPPREVPGSAAAILDCLTRYGFRHDGPVTYQSRQMAHYRDCAEHLVATGKAYYCTCSRKDILEAGIASPLGGARYPGTCRHLALTANSGGAIRVVTNDEPIEFEDQIQGSCSYNLARESGDFVIFRRDGFPAYQLAVVVDDFRAGITQVVRGADLLDSTPRQLWLQQLLGYTRPAYLHLPVVVDDNGQKLSKQTGAPGLSGVDPGDTLCQALRFLRQSPPAGLAAGPVELIWRWAVENWQPQRMRGLSSCTAEHQGT